MTKISKVHNEKHRSGGLKPTLRTRILLKLITAKFRVLFAIIWINIPRFSLKNKINYEINIIYNYYLKTKYSKNEEYENVSNCILSDYDEKIFNKLKIYQNIAFKYKLIYKMISLPFIRYFLKLSTNNISTKLEELAKIYYELGELFYHRDINSLSYNYFKKALIYNNKDNKLFNYLGVNLLKELEIISRNKYNFKNKVLIYLKSRLAIYHFKQALKLNQNFLEAYKNIGNIYISLGKAESAKQYYNKILTIDEHHCFAYNNLGNVYIEFKQYDKALECFNKSIQINTDQNHAFLNKGYLYYLQEDYKNAIFYLEESIKNEPLNYKAYILQYFSYFKLNDLDLAEKCFEKSLSLFFQKFDSFIYSALFYKANNLNKIANEYYLKILISTLGYLEDVSDVDENIKHKYLFYENFNRKLKKIARSIIKCKTLIKF